MKRTLAACALLALIGRGVEAQDAKQPWLLTFTHGPLTAKSLTYRDGTARTFYYFTFKVDNKSQTDATLNLHIKAVVGSNPKKRRTHIATPEVDVEESVRRLARARDLKNVQQINEMKTLASGESVRGIAVLGTFHREWDAAMVTVSGLEPASRKCRVRIFGDSGFTLPHRAYHHHNGRVRKAAGEDADYREEYVILKHNVLWVMHFHREGDEFSPQLDPIYLDNEGWDVVGTEIVTQLKAPFGGE